MAYDPFNDPELDDIKARVEAARDADTTEQLTKDIHARRLATEHPISRFMANLPKNVTLGGWKALVSTVDTAADAITVSAPQTGGAKSTGGEEAPQAVGPTLSEQYPEVMGSLRNFTTEWERNDTLSDDIVQGIAQFALPFMGWLKLSGGVSGMSKTAAVGKGLALEAGTAASAFDPQEGRVADLLELGRESETRLGTLLRQVAPDESLMNQYIDYMTNRTDEGAAEGRFKNAVDAVVSSAAVAGLLKGVATTHKTTKILVDGALEDLMTPSSFGPGKQRGMVAFHGTPHDFDAFDLSKIGTGEGNQVYGHGLYFAEAEGTAKHYRGALSRKAFSPGSAMENAYSAMENANWDAKQAYTTLMQKAARAQDQEWRDTLTNAASKIKAGNVKQLGKLMTVDIPDEAVAKMINWDAPLSQQPTVVAALKKTPQWDMIRSEFSGTDEQVLETITGKDVYDILKDNVFSDEPTFAAEKASNWLNEAGIPGIRYMDQQSRGKAKGTSNLVLFDDKLVTITKKE